MTGIREIVETANTRSIRSILSDKRTSAYRKYKDLTIGDMGFLHVVVHEILSLFLVPFPGALGILLRRIVYKGIFRSCGRGLIVGRNCIFRHPSKISMGNDVTIDDMCLVDGRGTEERGIVLGDGVILNRNTTVQAKGGDILIGRSVSIGANSTLVSWGGLRIGEGTVIAGGCSISAGRFDYSELNRSVAEQEAYTTGPIVIGKNVWLATGVTILDGVRIGDDAIVSAGSVVTSTVPPKAIASGNPAKPVFTRR